MLRVGSAAGTIAMGGGGTGTSTKEKKKKKSCVDKSTQCDMDVYEAFGPSLMTTSSRTTTAAEDLPADWFEQAWSDFADSADAELGGSLLRDERVVVARRAAIQAEIARRAAAKTEGAEAADAASDSNFRNLLRSLGTETEARDRRVPRTAAVAAAATATAAAAAVVRSAAAPPIVAFSTVVFDAEEEEAMGWMFPLPSYEPKAPRPPLPPDTLEGVPKPSDWKDALFNEVNHLVYHEGKPIATAVTEFYQRRMREAEALRAADDSGHAGGDPFRKDPCSDHDFHVQRTFDILLHTACGSSEINYQARVCLQVITESFPWLGNYDLDERFRCLGETPEEKELLRWRRLR